MFTLSCPTGTFDTTAQAKNNGVASNGEHVLTYGIINDSTENKSFCNFDEYTDPYNCKDYIDDVDLQADLAAFNGKDKLSLSGFATSKYRSWKKASDAPSQEIIDECFKGSSTMFIQVACVIPETEITTRKVQGLFIACLTIAIALYVSIFTDYIRQVAKNNFVEWDIKTVTAGDYTIEFDITDEFYDKFVRDFGPNKPESMPMAAYFRDWIQNEMEEKLLKIPDLGYEDNPPERIEIAATTFAFENADLIALLKKRGAAIKADKFEEMRKIDL